MAMLANDIYIGSVSTPLYHFTNRSLELGSTKGKFAVDTIGNELSVDEFQVIVRYAPGGSSALLYAPVGKDAYRAVGNKLYALAQLSAKDFMKELPFGTPVWWYTNSSFFAKGYLKSVDRIGKYAFKLTCISGVGLLDTKIHTGGLYNGETIGTILASIIGNTVTYSVSNAVSGVQVYGHLPYDTARNNLHRLLFSCGAALVKGNQTTDYSIVYLSSTVTQVPASRVALGGRVDYQLPTNKVEITEHGFFQTANDETVVLYDNTLASTANNLTVIFENAPAYDLQVTGSLTISESGVNHAVVSGTGVLTGKMYTHTRQIVTMSEMSPGDVERVKRVENNELISSVNSRNVARRVLSFYKSARTIKAKIMLDSEKCGSMLQFTDAFGDVTAGFLQKMDVLTTTVKGADCVLVDGYAPGNEGNNYLHYLAVTASRTFTVPAGVYSIRIILIGGGQGGQGGYDGENGRGAADMVTEVTSTQTITGYAPGTQPVPQGGAAGGPGEAGKVAIYDIDVSPGQVITLTVGSGGAGGARNGGAGGAGGASTVSGTGISLSSENGIVMENGWYDTISGNTYATPGENGTAGYNGGQTDTISLEGINGAKGLYGDGVHYYVPGMGVLTSGGEGGFGASGSVPGLDFSQAKASGGGGGGAALGVRGGNGSSASVTSSQSERNAYSGDGGNGASPNAPSQATTAGRGGKGGSGGGAGGNAGGAQTFIRYTLDESWKYTLHIGNGGTGGRGSIGGQGGNGIIVIYY